MFFFSLSFELQRNAVWNMMNVHLFVDSSKIRKAKWWEREERSQKKILCEIFFAFDSRKNCKEEEKEEEEATKKYRQRED